MCCVPTMYRVMRCTIYCGHGTAYHDTPYHIVPRRLNLGCTLPYRVPSNVMYRIPYLVPYGALSVWSTARYGILPYLGGCGEDFGVADAVNDRVDPLIQTVIGKNHHHGRNHRSSRLCIDSPITVRHPPRPSDKWHRHSQNRTREAR